MTDLLPVVTAAEMRGWEAGIFEAGDVAERVVLESAGRAVALAVARDFPEGRIVGGVGGGKNGGDTVVALRTLRSWGRDVAAFGEARVIRDPTLTHGWEIPVVSSSAAELDEAGVLLDGILGTGASGPPRDPQLALISAINGAARPIVAVDGPSGVDLTTGRVEREAVRASLTITFGALKRGLTLFPGREHAGRILLAEVGFPPRADSTGVGLIHDGWAWPRLPRVAPDAHKGRQGVVAIVAGHRGFAGAAIMAAMGALRAGAGGVRLVSSEDNRALLQTAVPEAVFIDRTDSELPDQLRKVSAILIGPGIGVDEEASELLMRILHLDLPMVIDADGITLLAPHPRLLAGRQRGPVVLTPHPAELGRLLGCSTEEVLADRIETAAAAARAQASVVLAKGAPSLVADPTGSVLVGSAGHSGVATGGMGDTLGGVVAAFLAAGVPALDAAGVGLHAAGRAAERAGQGRGLLPRDVAEALPEVLLRARPPEVPQPPFLHELPAPR